MILTIVIILTFLFMEFVAWFMHKYVMHGFAWELHRDHHKRDGNDSFLEMNDFFFVFFAALSMIAFSIWSYASSSVALGVGIGISIYGLVYTFIHEIFIHQRVKVLSRTKSKYLLGLRRAHNIHHKHLGKHEGECFGMLWIPLKYFK